MAINKKITKRDLAAQATRKHLFETATKLFAEYGFNQVTVDDITKYANVAKGTFYNHFDSKESILIEQFGAIDEQYEKALSAIPPETTASDQLRLVFHTLFEYCQNSAGVETMRAIYINEISDKNQIRKQIDRDRTLYHHLLRISELGISSSEFNISITPEKLVQYLLRIGWGQIYDWCLNDGGYDLIQEGDNFADALIRQFTK